MSNPGLVKNNRGAISIAALILLPAFVLISFTPVFIAQITSQKIDLNNATAETATIVAKRSGFVNEASFNLDLAQVFLSANLSLLSKGRLSNDYNNARVTIKPGTTIPGFLAVYQDPATIQSSLPYTNTITLPIIKQINSQAIESRKISFSRIKTNKEIVMVLDESASLGSNVSGVIQYSRLLLQQYKSYKDNVPGTNGLSILGFSDGVGLNIEAAKKLASQKSRYFPESFTTISWCKNNHADNQCDATKPIMTLRRDLLADDGIYSFQFAGYPLHTGVAAREGAINPEDPSQQLDYPPVDESEKFNISPFTYYTQFNINNGFDYDYLYLPHEKVIPDKVHKEFRAYLKANQDKNWPFSLFKIATPKDASTIPLVAHADNVRLIENALLFYRGRFGATAVDFGMRMAYRVLNKNWQHIWTSPAQITLFGSLYADKIVFLYTDDVNYHSGTNVKALSEVCRLFREKHVSINVIDKNNDSLGGSDAENCVTGPGKSGRIHLSGSLTFIYPLMVRNNAIAFN